MRGSKMGKGWGQGDPHPPENHKNVECLSNTGSESLENYKATKIALKLGDHRHASEAPFKRRFAGGLMMARL